MWKVAGEWYVILPPNLGMRCRRRFSRMKVIMPHSGREKAVQK